LLFPYFFFAFLFGFSSPRLPVSRQFLAQKLGNAHNVGISASFFINQNGYSTQ